MYINFDEISIEELLITLSDEHGSSQWRVWGCLGCEPPSPKLNVEVNIDILHDINKHSIQI